MCCGIGCTGCHLFHHSLIVVEAGKSIHWIMGNDTMPGLLQDPKDHTTVCGCVHLAVHKAEAMTVSLTRRGYCKSCQHQHTQWRRQAEGTIAMLKDALHVAGITGLLEFQLAVDKADWNVTMLDSA